MIVVVGANGFLGRHFCEFLESRREPAVAVSRQPDAAFFERFAPSLRTMTPAALASTGGDELMQQAKAVIYLTWSSVPATFDNEPWREVPENVLPAFEFFSRVAAISNPPKIILLSSGGTIYGGEDRVPKTEASATRPMSAYGIGKLMAEEALRFVSRIKGTSFAILRVSNALGRWQTNTAQGVVGVALRAAREGVGIKLYGGGTQVRDFVDADDVAEAIYAASLDVEHPGATWNVGSGVGLKIIDVLEIASRVIGKPIRTESAPARALDVPYVVLDCQKIEHDLGWRAKTSIDRSILSLWQTISPAV
jgi:UDP-glucose 4-epimerase